jgi:pilus assembly protein FimV
VLKTDKKSNLLKMTAIAMAMAIIPLAGHAAGLGKVAVFSSLGQPLKAEIEISANSEELSSLQAKLASVDAFRQADIEYNPILSNLKFSREPIERNGHRYVQVTTDKPVNEPFINMLVELGWASGRLVREYTFLLDPPDTTPATTAASVSPPVGPLAVDKLQSDKNLQVENTSPAMTRQSPKVRPTVEASDKLVTGANVKNHKVRTGDTLGKIAAKMRPDGVNLDQMLVALLRANQAAFDDGNMNRLKAGKILAIPDAEVIHQITTGEAKKEVVAQAADFNAYRKRLASAASAQTDVRDSGQQVVSGKITPKVEEVAPAPSDKDKLEISKSENVKGSVSDAKGSAAADALARDKALKEARSRTVELEQNLNKMKQLAELQNKAGADIRQQAQVEASAKDAVSSAPLLAVETPVNPPAAKTEVKKVKVSPLVPEPESSFLEENGTLVFGGGGILALLFGWMGYSAWKKKKENDELGELGGMSAASEFSIQSTFGPSIDPTTSSSFSSTAGDQGESQFSVSAPGAVEPSVDALSQADTFLAFGRTEQAEEVLISALEVQPNRHELYLKLLGIYAEQDKPAEYESLAKRFREQTLEDGPDWETARVMGAVLDPQNVLYQLPSTENKLSEVVTGVGGVTLAGVAAVAAQAVPETFVESASNDQDIQPIDTENLDFDLDFDLDEATLPASKIDSAAPVALAASSEEMPVLDFDFDLSLPEAPSATVLEAVATPAPLDISLAEKAGNGIDFDFDLPLADAPPALTNVSDLKSDALDLDLDLDADLSAPTFSVAGNDDVDNSEVATKLELAAAYEEMGDNSGASELYQEALAEGSKTQQEFARGKLASLA